MENKDQPDRFSRFYVNRALRIMPLYYLVLFCFFIAIFFLVKEVHVHRFDYYIDSWASFVFFLQNWTLIIKGTPLEEHLVHFWSLAVEEQFYLFWPVVLYTFYQKKHLQPALVVTVVLILISRCLLYAINPNPMPILRYYHNTFLRMDAILIGAYTYFLTKKQINNLWLFKTLPILSLAILIVGLLTAENIKNHGAFFGTVGYTALAILYAFILYRIVIHPSSIMGRIFNNAFLRKTGKISYGFYVIHWPVLVVLGGGAWAGLLSKVLCMVLSFALSLISFYSFEGYFLKRKK
jgi:Predicted acyltransferases